MVYKKILNLCFGWGPNTLKCSSQNEIDKEVFLKNNFKVLNSASSLEFVFFNKGLEKVYVPDVHEESEEPYKLFVSITQKNQINEEYYFELWTKIRFSYGFKNERILWTKIMLLSISIISKLNFNSRLL
jgi:hypothetical protein